ncbi:hypothetical protein AB1Y20_007673 [Prymnesium parvum]|uniref:Uncharacterized protein n=1 Tax=Prymnesium parvum TaxID=97485 RepID=A0AB34IWS7_PRYPA|eukprot:CAMPEP_0182807570 /NCGR_PEP_ID=MMETSP0006_2-20121128/6200_1 /TAXON_ID=97485 /ORGANISM="Prymnesium parvum, Strain Texoma1" /LENGTH=187 /DNA_ID=CAMNT_0024933255 /DNA_START=19 /DNA_END=582 /DNA_ORIENTATION=+
MATPWAAQYRERSTEARAQAAREGPSLPWAKGAGSINSQALPRAHRSVRMAHSLGVLSCVVAAACILIAGPGMWSLGLIAAGALLARAGGAWLHGVLPALLVDSPHPPAPGEMSVVAANSLFSLSGLRQPVSAFRVEWDVLLENLAFTCTYGKRNCLTNDMYSGELSLGKIVSLVSAKLSEGVVRCN